MKTDIDILIYMCLIDTKASFLTPPVKHSLCYLSPIILIRFGGFTIGLWSYITQHSSTLIDWISSSSLYPTFPFSSYFYIPWYHVIQQNLYSTFWQLLNVRYWISYWLEQIDSVKWQPCILKKKVSNINFCKKVCTDVLHEFLGPVKKARNTLTKRICAASAQKDNFYPNIKIKKEFNKESAKTPSSSRNNLLWMGVQ